MPKPFVKSLKSLSIVSKRTVYLCLQLRQLSRTITSRDTFHMDRRCRMRLRLPCKKCAGQILQPRSHKHSVLYSVSCLPCLASYFGTSSNFFFQIAICCQLFLNQSLVTVLTEFTSRAQETACISWSSIIQRLVKSRGQCATRLDLIHMDGEAFAASCPRS